MNELARPKMNVPKALLRRRRFLQARVDEAYDCSDSVTYYVAEAQRKEIKWLNYMLRETTGKGRVRTLADESVEPIPAWKTCPHTDFPPLVSINERENWCNDCQKYVLKVEET